MTLPPLTSLPPLPSLLECLGVMVAIVANDFSWAFYTKRVSDARAAKAGLWAVSIFLTSAVATYSWLNNYWLVLVAAATSFVGTYTAVRFDNRKKKQKPAEPQLLLETNHTIIQAFDDPPANPGLGQRYYNTKTRCVMIYMPTGWQRSY